ncbi:ATP-dependent DNA helicase, partial [Paraburkholderia sp. BR14319]
MNSTTVSRSRPAREGGAPEADARAAQTAAAPMLSARRAAELEELFAADGLLAREIDGYRPRAAQIEMARAVAAAMEAAAQSLPDPAAFELQSRPARRVERGAPAQPAAGVAARAT